jgi:hypothetical protein
MAAFVEHRQSESLVRQRPSRARKDLGQQSRLELPHFSDRGHRAEVTRNLDAATRGPVRRSPFFKLPNKKILRLLIDRLRFSGHCDVRSWYLAAGPDVRQRLVAARAL